jgi:carbon starvation protein
MFTVAATIPIAMFMGIYSRYLRPGRIAEMSLIGFVLLMASIFVMVNLLIDILYGVADPRASIA